MSKSEDFELEKMEQIERGKRIRFIREKELGLNKTQLAKKIGVSSQFLGLVEDGKGNLVYRSIKKLKILSGHSADYILFGIDDNIIKDTKKLLKKYSEKELIDAISTIESLATFIRNSRQVVGILEFLGDYLQSLFYLFYWIEYIILTTFRLFVTIFLNSLRGVGFYDL